MKLYSPQVYKKPAFCPCVKPTVGAPYSPGGPGGPPWRPHPQVILEASKLIMTLLSLSAMTGPGSFGRWISLESARIGWTGEELIVFAEPEKKYLEFERNDFSIVIVGFNL